MWATGCTSNWCEPTSSTASSISRVIARKGEIAKWGKSSKTAASRQSDFPGAPSAIRLLAAGTKVVDDCKRASEVSNIVHCSAVICIRRRSVLVRHRFTLKTPGSFQLPAIKPKRRSREAVTR
jgi:hypothetical protein